MDQGQSRGGGGQEIDLSIEQHCNRDRPMDKKSVYPNNKSLSIDLYSGQLPALSGGDPFRLKAHCFYFFCRDSAVFMFSTLIDDKIGTGSTPCGQRLESILFFYFSDKGQAIFSKNKISSIYLFLYSCVTARTFANFLFNFSLISK